MMRIENLVQQIRCRARVWRLELLVGLPGERDDVDPRVSSAIERGEQVTHVVVRVRLAERHRDGVVSEHAHVHATRGGELLDRAGSVWGIGSALHTHGVEEWSAADTEAKPLHAGGKQGG